MVFGAQTSLISAVFGWFPYLITYREPHAVAALHFAELHLDLQAPDYDVLSPNTGLCRSMPRISAVSKSVIESYTSM